MSVGTWEMKRLLLPNGIEETTWKQTNICSWKPVFLFTNFTDIALQDINVFLRLWWEFGNSWLIFIFIFCYLAWYFVRWRYWSSYYNNIPHPPTPKPQEISRLLLKVYYWSHRNEAIASDFIWIAIWFCSWFAYGT